MVALAVAQDRPLVDFCATQIAVRSKNWTLAVSVGFASLLWLLLGAYG